MEEKLPRLSQRSLLRIQQLNMILRLIEHRSVSGAAVDLGLSQSAVTKALKEVESIFGAPLFHREQRGLRPTSYCDAVELFARDTMLGLDEAFGSIGALLRGEEGSVSIGTSPGTPQQLLSMGLESLREQAPRLQIELRADSGPSLMTLLDDGSIDFALMLLPPSLSLQRYAYVPIGKDPVIALVRTGHPLLKHDGITSDVLMDATWALPPRREPLRERIAFVLMSVGIDQPPNLIEVHSSSAALELAVSMDLVVFVPESQAQIFIRQRLLQPLTLPFSLPALPYGLLRIRHRQMRPGSLTALRCVLQQVRRTKRRTTMPGESHGSVLRDIRKLSHLGRVLPD